MCKTMCVESGLKFCCATVQKFPLSEKKVQNIHILVFIRILLIHKRYRKIYRNHTLKKRYNKKREGKEIFKRSNL